MNTLQLQCVLDNCSYTKNLNCIVCSKNLVPQNIVRKPAILIINSDNSWESGQHWFCIFIPENGPCNYFDPLGKSVKMYSQSLQSLMLKQYINFTSNQYRYQDFNSKSCGQFCLYFVISRAMGFNLMKILNSLSRFDLICNEILITKFYKKIKNDCCTL